MIESKRVQIFLRTLLGMMLALAAAGVVAAEAPSLAGHWEGVIDLPGTKLAINIDFAAVDGGWKGDISIPLQGAKDMPLDKIALDGAAVSFIMPGVPGDPVFKGALSADGSTISGDFTQGGATFPFELSRAAKPTEAAKGALADFDDFVTAAMKAWNVPGLAMAVVKDGEAVYLKGFGYRDVEQQLPVTPDTLFAIGSCSKAFTTFVMGTLVDEGKLDWETPVRTYIPWFKLYDPFATERITPRDLVTHRSGLPRHDAVWYNNLGASREELVRRLAYLEPSADLRAKWQYNNLMFLTAGYLVETITGKPWEDAVRDRVFGPLGMKDSNFSVLDSQKAADFAWPYREKDDQLERIPFRVITNVGPAGSINSSVRDMAQWLKVQSGGGKLDGQAVIKASTLADIQTPHMATGQPAERPEISAGDYGLGWMIDVYRGHKRVHHGGGIDGFISQVQVLPQDGLGIVVLTNSETGLSTIVAQTALDRLLKLDPIDWNGEALARRAKGKAARLEAKEKKETARVPGTSPSHALADYAGEYRHPGYGTLSVALREDKLEATYNGITAPLGHWHYDVFTTLEAKDDVMADTKFNFRTDMSGQIASVEAPMEPAVKDIVFVKQPDARLSDPAYLQRFTGEYELAGLVAKVGLKGNTLTLRVPGQPEYELVPGLGGLFHLKEVTVIQLRFLMDDAGNVTGLESRQPEGVYTAKKK
jgi:CubicO group peptidase (beta-lactamase class C family)